MVKELTFPLCYQKAPQPEAPARKVIPRWRFGLGCLQTISASEEGCSSLALRVGVLADQPEVPAKKVIPRWRFGLVCLQTLTVGRRAAGYPGAAASMVRLFRYQSAGSSLAVSMQQAASTDRG